MAAAAEAAEVDKVTRSSIATGGAHASMVLGSQTQPIGETQAAYAVEIKRVAVGDSMAFAAVAAGGRAAGAWVLAPIPYVVTGTPVRRRGGGGEDYNTGIFF